MSSVHVSVCLKLSLFLSLSFSIITYTIIIGKEIRFIQNLVIRFRHTHVLQTKMLFCGAEPEEDNCLTENSKSIILHQMYCISFRAGETFRIWLITTLVHFAARHHMPSDVAISCNCIYLYRCSYTCTLVAQTNDVLYFITFF